MLLKNTVYVLALSSDRLLVLILSDIQLIPFLDCPSHSLQLCVCMCVCVCVLCTAAFLVLSIWQSLWLVLGYIYVRSLSLIRLHFHQSIFPVIVHSELEALCPKCQLTEVTVTNSGRKTNV